MSCARNHSASVAKPSVSETAGVQCNASRVSRWSNQCAVESCSARNRVIGGSSRPPRRAHDPLDDRPPTRASRARDVRGAGARRRRPRQMPREELGDGARLAVRHARRARPPQLLGVVERGDERVGGVVDVGRVDERGAGADERAAGRVGRARRCGRRAACRPVPTRGAAATTTTGSVRRSVGREREHLGGRLAPARSGRGRAGIGGPGGCADERAAGVRDRRRRDVHEPAHAARRAGVDEQLRVPPMLTCSNSRHRPGDADLRGEVHDGVAGRRRPRRDGRGVDDVAEHLARAEAASAAAGSAVTSSPRAASARRPRRRAGCSPR